MNNFNFGEVLTRAWQNIWKHKVLWIFGILASCARGGGGGSGGGGNSGFQSGSGDAPFSSGQFEQFANQAGRYLEENWWIFIVAALAIILFAFISYSLGMIGRIGMIKGTALAEKGVESMSFGEIWSDSLPYFWRIFGLNFLIGLAFLVIFLPLMLIGVVTAGIGFVCLLPIICLLIPIGWLVSMVIEQAQPAIVLEDLGMWDGIKRGWELVRPNIVPLIILSLILGIGGAIIGLIIAIPLIVAFVPLIIGAGSLRELFMPLYISLACCAVYMPVLIFLNGILTAYIQSVWALTYLRLAKPKEEPPVIIEANA